MGNNQDVSVANPATKIPIVLASDKNCFAQMYITMLSAIVNKKRETFYEFYCLVPKYPDLKILKKFQKLEKKGKNISIRFINMKNAFSNMKMQLSHITSPTFYRLKIADTLPQYEKALYLDIDTIILKDLSGLFDTDLGDNYIGGVHSAWHEIMKNKLKDYYDNLGINNLNEYVNAGVILFNLKQIRKDNITEKFIEHTQNTYKYMDQDIINLVCYKKIKNLDFKYNVMTPYKQNFLDDLDLCKRVFKIYGEEQLQEAINSPVIVHYASSVKPWINKNVWLAKYWLFYAKKSPIKIKRYKNEEMLSFLKQVSENRQKKIIFWGASLFLKDLILSRKIKKYKILGIVDNDSSKHGSFYGNLQIYSPDEIPNLKPDAIIVAVKNSHQTTYEQVKSFIEQNCPRVKLLPDAFERKS